VANLLNRETGQVEFIHDSQVAAALASQRYELPEQVRAQDAGGAVLATPDVLQERGLGFEQPGDAYDIAREAELESQYGDGFGNNAKALLAGGARGLSLGLSDLALKGILDDDGEFALEQLRLRNQIATTAGEIGGALAPALLSGGAGLLGSAARLTPTGVLTRLGAGAAARVSGETAASAAMRGALQAGIEGAGLGLGNAITQAALHDDPFIVESVASNMSLGAVLGGVTGGLLGAGGALARRSLSVSTPVDDVASGFTNVLGKSDELIVAAREARKAGMVPAELSDDVLAVELREARSLLGRKGAAASQGLDKNAMEAVDFPGMQRRLMDRVGGTTTGASDAAEALLKRSRAGLTRDLGDDLDIGRIFSMDKKRAVRVAEHLDNFAVAARALDDQVGQRFGVKLAVGDEAIKAKLADAGLDSAYAKILDSDIAQRLGKSGNAAFEAKLAEMDPMAKTVLKAWVANKSVTAEAAKRGWFSNLVVSSATGAGRNMIPSGVRGAGMFSSIARGAARNVGGFIGSKLGRVAAGGAAGYAIGGKDGVMEGALFGASASGANAARVGSMAARAVSALAKPSTAKALTAASILGATKFGQEKDKNPARARMKEIAAAITNPATKRAIQTATLPLHLQNPAVGEKVQMALEMRLAYLGQRSPWRPPMKAMRTFKAEVNPSRYEVAKWARVVRAAENPLSLLEDLENRRLTPEAVNTVKDLYPEMFSRMQVAVMEQVGALKEGLPYQSRLQVAVFFDTPVDASQTPEFGSTMQGLYDQAAQNQPQPRGSLGTPSPDTTQVQRLTSPM
jgi:hypothetical protein